MIVVVGGAEEPNIRFIDYLNSQNFNDLVIVADHKSPIEIANLRDKRILKRIRYNELSRFIDAGQRHIQFIVVLGKEVGSYASLIWEKCIEWGIPLVILQESESEFNRIADTENSPYFWSVIQKQPQTPFEEVMDFTLHQMRERKQSGIVIK